MKAIFIFVTVVVLALTGVDGAVQHTHCPGNATLPWTVIPCDYDCKTNHAALGGTCTTDGNYNCICNESGKHPYTGVCTYFYSFINVPTICQCYSNGPVLGALYAAICENDCQCHHGAAGGTCDWTGRACLCDYNFPAGESWNSSYCVIGDEYKFLQQLFGNSIQGVLNAIPVVPIKL